MALQSQRRRYIPISVIWIFLKSEFRFYSSYGFVYVEKIITLHSQQEVLIQRSINRSSDLKLSYLTSLGIQSFAQCTGITGTKPSLVFEASCWFHSFISCWCCWLLQFFSLQNYIKIRMKIFMTQTFTHRFWWRVMHWIVRTLCLNC